jgi:very-short-patch-repair endonuclease
MTSKSDLNPAVPRKSGVVFLQKINDGKVAFSRDMRAKPTPAERILWNYLRNRQQSGLKFRRQQIIEGFIADFYCEAAKLVIEIDGIVHESGEQKEIDTHRRIVFEARGLKEIRISNGDIFLDIGSVLHTIIEATLERIRH